MGRAARVALAACVACAAAALAVGGCGGSDWVGGSGPRGRPGGPNGGWQGSDVAVSPLTGPASTASAPKAEGDRTPISISEHGASGVYRNTYYDFPQEAAGGARTAKVFDAECKLIANVLPDFHDKVCVQGSGRLSTGETISFARRDCECAAVCPRTDQKICFEKLDPQRFPSGRGATGAPVIPLRSVAVDDKLIPLGTPLFIPDYKGLPRLDGAPHDGCFIAEDRGLKVVGRHVDIFTGSPKTTEQWNKLVPSNQGVEVVIDAAQCRHLAGTSRPGAQASPAAAGGAP